MPKSIDISEIRTDGGTQPRINLYEETVTEYREAIYGGAEFPPVVVFHDGSDYWMADGFHRFHAYRQAGCYEIPAEVHQGTRREAVLYSVGANSAHGLRRTNDDKRRAVMTLLEDEEWSRWSANAIAKQCCVSHDFAARMKKESGPSLSSDESETGQRTYTNKHGTTATMNTSNIGRGPKDDPQHFATTHEDHKQIAPQEPEPSHNHRAQGTGENEWYTPAKYIDMAKRVMGGIDLDPASSKQANKAVGAGKIFTEQDNGLNRFWFGSVWLNPPYSQPAISHFADKVKQEWQGGNVTAMLVLTHNYTDTRWFHTMATCASALCFTRGRIAFESPTGEKAAPTQGQVFFYFGNDVATFADVFGEEGFVVEVSNG